ncbi:MAG TPA: fumarylacetoacetate hydrolase family protein [Ramlibacter sp.]|uniref:fumarylacetoacetate hydrolase family protein n=1 Tax=Ramlibacter sp. TaxID=1917967 RepID=UPI002CA039D9|nr:fumarylacetoacetate hydrolase family protein [Ramlibacter sp.]HVZ43559.1 fumarylacetoacetate hydrolase family protein [Ramlibacter sp.]
MAIDPLPSDLDHALLAGRVWHTGQQGPCVVAVREGQTFDITDHAPTMADLLDRPDLAAFLRQCEGTPLGSAREWMARSQDPARQERLLAPCDLQPIKACGVTFAVSLLERVIEEQSGGDPRRAEAVRADLQRTIGGDLRSVAPGSEGASRLKEELMRRGVWSQYLEVGIGPDAEVFTKAAPMSAIGHGAVLGLLPDSTWNNPEPEIVLAVNSRLEIAGATLGNDVNLRDVEGRSALLLGRAKDNNGSCAIGPFIRVFDERFTLDTVRACRVQLRIEGAQDGFELDGVSDMREISRDPADLVRQAAGAHHQYPDGFMLFLGTMFSPVKDRDGPGLGFTHKPGDRVTIAAPPLGALVNTVGDCTRIPPWTFGIRALYRSLALRQSPAS